MKELIIFKENSMKNGTSKLPIDPKTKGEETLISKFFIVFGLINQENGQQAAGSMEVSKDEYELIKPQIANGDNKIFFKPVIDVRGMDEEGDVMCINTDKYAYVTTKHEQRSSLIIHPSDGLNLVDSKGSIQ